MALVRPTKEGGATTYQGKVALGFKDILASEADADHDTMYAAWNGTLGGDLTGTLPNPTVSATAKSKWTVSGSTLAPTDATKTVTIPGDPAAIIGPWFGAGTVKARLQTANTLAATGSLRLSVNHNWQSGAQDDASKPSWLLQLRTDSDNLLIQRQPAGGAFASLVTLDNTGALTLTGILTGASPIRLTGTTNGLKCQNVGNMTGDGYGNSIAFGWTTTVQCRVDSTLVGSVNITPPSDERVKVNVQTDVPGLDAVLALRPITFEYDQTKRQIGFPQGRHYGLVAQEAHAHVPLAVEDDGSDEHWLALDYRVLVPVLIRAMQELAARLEAMETSAA